MRAPSTQAGRDQTPDIAVIEPMRGKNEQPLPSAGLLVFTPQDIQLVLQSLPCWPERLRKLYLAEVYRGVLQNREIAIVGPALGAPQTVMILEKLIALGVTDVVALGWCGSLQPHVQIGDVVIPTGAISEEGTSAHYPLGGTPPGPAPGLRGALEETLKRSDLKAHTGYVWTTDAPYRETARKILTYQQEGVLAVEMEVSALFTVARFRSIRLAAALIVSDDLHTLKWLHGFKDAKFHLAREKVVGIALEVLAAVA